MITDFILGMKTEGLKTVGGPWDGKVWTFYWCAGDRKMPIPEGGVYKVPYQRHYYRRMGDTLEYIGTSPD